jgi:adenylate cyclase
VLDAVYDWLLDGGSGAAQAVDVVDRVGNELAAAGLPLLRLGVFVTTLHPNVAGRAFIWERGKPTRVAEQSLTTRATADYTHSPIARVSESGIEWRWRAGEPDRYPVIADLAARGCVDYVALPMRFVDGETHVITLAADAGFSDEQLAAVRHLVRPLARLAEILAMRRTATNILETYVGKSAGARVWAGSIRKGDVETIRCALWFSDLRGFTEMSSRRTAREVIAVLNDVFDCQVPAIDKHGGEVLKFIGDGLLAIFPIAGPEDVQARCVAAIDAAREALAAIDQLAGWRIGVALHLGDVAYGNIGGASRLDFTAIGMAVNLCARLEGIASKLGRALVVSAELAAAAGRPVDDLGTFELKGIAEPQHVYALASL